MMDKKNLKPGLTLIEALVSAVLLGVGVAGLLSAATLSIRNEKRTENQTSAMYMAQSKLSQVELLGPHIYSLGEPTSGTENVDGVIYDWNIEIQQLTAGELFDVVITTNWKASG